MRCVAQHRTQDPYLIACVSMCMCNVWQTQFPEDNLNHTRVYHVVFKRLPRLARACAHALLMNSAKHIPHCGGIDYAACENMRSVRPAQFVFLPASLQTNRVFRKPSESGIHMVRGKTHTCVMSPPSLPFFLTVA